MRSQDSLHKLCISLILMIMLTEVKHTSQSYLEREVMCISTCNFLAHYVKKEECKEVTYRVYSFVTTSQAHPDILSCDLNKHVSWLSVLGGTLKSTIILLESFIELVAAKGISERREQ